MVEFSFDCLECGDEILYEVEGYVLVYSGNDLDVEVTCKGCGETFDAHLSYSY